MTCERCSEDQEEVRTFWMQAESRRMFLCYTCWHEYTALADAMGIKHGLYWLGEQPTRKSELNE